MRFLGRLFLLFLSAGGIHAQTAVSFCDLVRNPEKFNGREIIVRATYRYGYEWSELYCLDCLDKGKAWLWMRDLDAASLRALKKLPKDAGIANLTVRGDFSSGGHFGDLNGYSTRSRPTRSAVSP
jgi:hypothetical protein